MENPVGPAQILELPLQSRAARDAVRMGNVHIDNALLAALTLALNVLMISERGKASRVNCAAAFRPACLPSGGQASNVPIANRFRSNDDMREILRFYSMPESFGR
ncbi:hypothetical protein A7J57_14045 [Agrobacterium tumefaciens]|uniref:Uncharacterized protein n=1 Tax=Agrobacterium tumefaciens TaxID=358 RepID=A0A176XDB5_AGRTU|nr:hypothetical protein A7J57_14045 [Agrobacterium tumefaciens]